MDILALFLPLAALIGLAYLGGSVLLLAPALAVVAALLGGQPGMASFTQIFMPAAGTFITEYFPLFLLGAVFGRLMDTTGAARRIADAITSLLGPQSAIAAVTLSCAVLTFGGVSLFVVAFAVYPLADALFRGADIPKRLIPASIALGAFTFTMTALPGTPAIQNAIPMPYFGTTAFAAPGLGIIAALIMGAGGMAWLTRRMRKAAAQGEGFGPDATPLQPATAVPLPEVGTGPDPKGQDIPARSVPLGLALAPILTVLCLNYVLSQHVLPGLDAAYLADPTFGATELGRVVGTWAIILSLVAGIAVLWAGLFRQMTDPIQTLAAGANASLLPVFNTASLVGFGAVVASLTIFGHVANALQAAPGGPAVSLALSTSLLAGITGSASGGMSIALQALGTEYASTAVAAGVDPALLHRVTTLATGGLDALPHNGAVVTLLAICGLSHRQAYGDIFVVAVATPVLALLAVLALGLGFGAF